VRSSMNMVPWEPSDDDWHSTSSSSGSPFHQSSSEEAGMSSFDDMSEPPGSVSGAAAARADSEVQMGYMPPVAPARAAHEVEPRVSAVNLAASGPFSRSSASAAVAAAATAAAPGHGRRSAAARDGTRSKRSEGTDEQLEYGANAGDIAADRMASIVAKDIATDGMTSFQKTAGVFDPLEPSVVYRLLNDKTERAEGYRPDFITDECIGRIYLERISGPPGVQRPRRRKGLDLWNQGMELVPKRLQGVTCGDDGKGEVWLKTVYGKVDCGQGGGRPKPYHMYELQYYYKGKAAAAAAAAAGSGQEQRHWRQGSQRDRGAAAVAAAKPESQKRRRESSEPAPRPDWIEGHIFHLRALSDQRPTAQSQQSNPGASLEGSAAAAAAGERRQTGQRQTGRLDLRLDQGESHWMQFEDESGEIRGSIENRERGVVLTATTGDFAEYHCRDSTQPAFEEGDVVGFGPQGLTRATKGMRQLGVISRQAIVAGSRPPPSADLSQWDLVAYIGRVPVKVIGSANQDDFLAPSGREDGTAVAVPGAHQTIPPARFSLLDCIDAINPSGGVSLMRSPFSSLSLKRVLLINADCTYRCLSSVAQDFPP
jgi:hypothetical protein